MYVPNITFGKQYQLINCNSKEQACNTYQNSTAKKPNRRRSTIPSTDSNELSLVKDLMAKKDGIFKGIVNINATCNHTITN